MINDVLIRNGIVMDGTGKAAFKADVIVRGERIEDIGNFPDAKASLILNAEGLVVAPGFIDRPLARVGLLSGHLFSYE